MPKIKYDDTSSSDEESSGEFQDDTSEASAEDKSEPKAGPSGLQDIQMQEDPNAKTDFEKIPRLICVEYPGIVKNTDKMIETLGGIEEISRTFSTDKKRLQLKFRPDNIYAKPAYGDKQNSAGLLLKVRVSKPTDPSAKREVISKEILGIVDAKYSFNTLCDYQFLPVHKNERTETTECIYEDIVPQGIVSSKWFTEKTDVPFFLPPTIFSRTDTVQQKILKNETPELAANGENFVKVIRKNRSKYGKIIPFSMTDPVPTKPNKSTPDLLKTKLIPQEHYDLIYNMFQKRPIWTRKALLSECEIEDRRLAYILTSVSYFYLTGPWRTCYVRFGYDPRKNFESRYYQILDYRVRQSGGFKNSVKAKRDSSLKKLSNVKLGKPNDMDEGDQKKTDRHGHIFDVNTVPSARVTFYQFSDVHIPKIQEMLYKIPTPLSGATCNEKTGWLPSLKFIDQCRNIMSEIAQKNLRNEFMNKKQGESMEDDATEATFDDDFEQEEEGFPDLEEDYVDEGESSKMEVD